LYRVKNILYTGESEFQDIKVAILEGYGRSLILDDVVQFTEKEEFIYHETLAHIPMFTHPDPKNVLIIGGGDGGIAREVLKHKSVEKLYLVDLDKKVTDITKEYFPSFRDVFDDKRLITLHIDGYKFVEETKDKFDVVLIDLTDPVGPAKALFEEPFYKMIFNTLSENGIMCCQNESIWYHSDIVKNVQKSLSNVFPIVDLFTLVTPVYTGYWWALSFASKKIDPRATFRKCDLETKYYGDDIRPYSFFPKSLLNRLRSGNLNY
ncbi:MAG TPA: polyamine aminopropyltransferase, partial [Spirochaetota bacterium]|nr:polyamine aminopropyltransferase [Spirochaetota bacterium]